MFPVDGLGGGGVDGGIGEGGGAGSALTTGVGAWSRLAIAEFRRRFTTDRDPPLGGLEPPPAEATGLAVAAAALGDGVDDLGGAVAAPIEAAPTRGLADDFAVGAVAGGAVVLVVSVAVPDTSEGWRAWEEVAGAGTDAMAGRLARVR